MNNFDMPTQLDVINFHNTHDTLCVPKGMTLKQLVEDYDRLNNIIKDLIKDIEIIVECEDIDILKMQLRTCLYNKLKELKENK